MLSLSKNAQIVLEKRYLQKNDQGVPIETPEEMFQRVAKTIASAEKNYKKSAREIKQLEKEFYRIMTALEFLPNSPTLMNAGRPLGQLSACFVLPIDDSMESIFETIKNTALIHQSGGGTGFSFSRLRPAGDMVKSTHGVSSGPISFMEVFNAATEAIKQGGTRRGANMGILRVDHPDIQKFITAKQDSTKLNNFNISVGITEKFMEAVKKNEEYELINPRTKLPVARLKAKDVFDQIVNLAWKNGEPGIVFLDRLNRDNPTPKLGEIESTNPCGEQPLLPYESCNLGSINLAKMLKVSKDTVSIDWNKLKSVVHLAVRFLDNVIDINRYPIPMIEQMTKGNRKIGLGVMGFADMLIQLSVPYNSDTALKLAEEIMSFIAKEAKKTSQELAKERGAFPNFKGSIYDKPGAKKLRNATTTTIAPTGSIGIIAGCSSGIEPLFAISYIRKTGLGNVDLTEVNPLFENIAKKRGFYSEALMQKIAELGSVQGIAEVPDDVKKIFVTAHDIAPEWHLKMQAAFQKYVDNAVSKTVNFPNSATPDDVAKVYWLAYELGCKGVTVYRHGSREEQVINIGKQNDSTSIRKHRVTPRPRPSISRGFTEKIKTGCGNLYVTVNEDEHGLCEVFTAMGKSGGCMASQSEATGRLISLALQAGVDPELIIKHLKGIRCPLPFWENGSVTLSCADAIGKAMQHYLERNHPVTVEPVKKETVQKTLVGICPQCPECGMLLEYQEGCIICRACGFSKCG
ncbi:MAG: vitamin B12-dependent ribonucleotide reductase [bacterium]|nr:vitamin B12-dependent ribonucleotide reductase [bacterium]